MPVKLYNFNICIEPEFDELKFEILPEEDGCMICCIEHIACHFLENQFLWRSVPLSKE
jgi:hypothetical protein